MSSTAPSDEQPMAINVLHGKRLCQLSLTSSSLRSLLSLLRSTFSLSPSVAFRLSYTLSDSLPRFPINSREDYITFIQAHQSNEFNPSELALLVTIDDAQPASHHSPLASSADSSSSPLRSKVVNPASSAFASRAVSRRPSAFISADEVAQSGFRVGIESALISAFKELDIEAASDHEYQGGEIVDLSDETVDYAAILRAAKSDDPPPPPEALLECSSFSPASLSPSPSLGPQRPPANLTSLISPQLTSFSRAVGRSSTHISNAVPVPIKARSGSTAPSRKASVFAKHAQAAPALTATLSGGRPVIISDLVMEEVEDLVMLEEEEESAALRQLNGATPRHSTLIQYAPVVWTDSLAADAGEATVSELVQNTPLMERALTHHRQSIHRHSTLPAAAGSVVKPANAFAKFRRVSALIHNARIESHQPVSVSVMASAGPAPLPVSMTVTAVGDPHEALELAVMEGDEEDEVEEDEEDEPPARARQQGHGRTGSLFDEFQPTISEILAIDGPVPLSSGVLPRSSVRRVSSVDPLSRPAIPQPAVEHVKRANRAMRLGDFASCSRDCSQAIDLAPLYANAYFTRALACSAVGDYQQVIHDCTAYIDLSGNNRLAQLDKALYNRALAFSMIREFASALEDYASLLSLNPSMALAYTGRANVFTELREFPRAIAEHRRALALEPNNGNAHHSMAVALAQSGQYEEGIEAENKAIELLKSTQSDIKYAIFNRGACYLQLQRFSDARCDFDSVLALEPNLSKAFAKRGLCWLYENAFDRALSDLERAVGLNPLDEVSKAAIAFIHEQQGEEVYELAQ